MGEKREAKGRTVTPTKVWSGVYKEGTTTTESGAVSRNEENLPACYEH